jgi:hypothetical protein
MCENNPSAVSNYPHGETLDIPTLITGSCRLITIFCSGWIHYYVRPKYIRFWSNGYKTIETIWVEL